MFWAAHGLHWRIQRASNYAERHGKSLNILRDWDRPLQFLVFNEEFLVNARQQRALITSLPFVHTARRSYRLDESMSLSEDARETASVVDRLSKVMQICSSRGRRSRNKVSVGEPAEGSLTQNNPKNQRKPTLSCGLARSEVRVGPQHPPGVGRGLPLCGSLRPASGTSRPNPINRTPALRLRTLNTNIHAS